MLRVPVINYLRACPLPKAKKRLDELAKLDPNSIQQANAFFPAAASAPSGQPDANDQKAAPAAPKPKAKTPGAASGARHSTFSQGTRA
jgi:hypothetical protein